MFITVWTNGGTIESANYTGSSWTNTGGGAIDLTPLSTLFLADITLDDSGNGFLVFKDFNETPNTASAIFYDQSTGMWNLTPVILSDSAFTSNFAPQVSTDIAGNAVVIYLVNIMSNNLVFSSRYDAETETWLDIGVNSVFLGVSGKNAQNPKIGLNRFGNGLGGWESGTELYALYYRGELVPENGTNFQGVAKENIFLTQTEEYNLLTWTESISSNVVGYTLKVNGQFLANITGKDTTSFTDQSVNRSYPSIYELSAVSNLGIESYPSYITID